MNSILKQWSYSDAADASQDKDLLHADFKDDKDNVDEDPFDRMVLPDRDLSTEGSSDDNEQIAKQQRKMSRDEALR